jgi:hypothetical protein
MAALPRVLGPILYSAQNKNDDGLIQQLAEYILLKTGTPPEWGSQHDSSVVYFGLASNEQQPYSLDADKVTRLNRENVHSISYAQLLDSLKIMEVALRICIETIFETSISMISSVSNSSMTSYSFKVITQNSGFAVLSELSCYIVVRDYVDHADYSSNSNGEVFPVFSIPNNVNGSALFVTFAKAVANPSIISFGVYSFGHNASSPEEKGTLVKLSPLNYMLNTSYSYPDVQKSGAFAFSYSYWTNLTVLTNSTRTAEYSFPHFLDKSSTILVLTGLNDTEYFAEWAAYPQIPLVIGANFDLTNFNADVFSHSYVVVINNALYALRIEGRRVG